MLGVTEQNNTLVVLVRHMATLQCTIYGTLLLHAHKA